VVSFRGNVATRLAKLAAGEADATLLAAAGLNRLGERGVGHPLAAEEWLPAPGQGAIAIECRRSDEATRELLGAIDDSPTHAALTAERALLSALGATCHSPVAALSRLEGTAVVLRAALFSPDGTARVDGEACCVSGDGEAPARLAADLLGRAPPSIAAHFAGPARVR
jgi:hydroxymethylbilane synthase